MVSRRATKNSTRSRPEFVHQFLIVLSGTAPLVWRRIQVPLAYSFWDLHLAIQDAMGWLDYHLHEFRLVDANLGGHPKPATDGHLKTGHHT